MGLLPEIMGGPPGMPFVMLDSDLANVIGDLKNETVHIRERPAVFKNLANNLASEYLEGRHVEMRRLSQHFLGHFARDPAPEVLDPGMSFFMEGGVNDIITLVDFLDEARNIGGLMLQVVIHNDHEITPCLAQPRHDGPVLTDVDPEIHPDNPGVQLGFGANGQPTAVRTAVVDENDFERITFERVTHRQTESGHDGLASEDGNDDADFGVIHAGYELPDIEP